jgi:hypothetical protein
VEVCPVKDTLAVTGMAMLAGFWQNSITAQEYQRRFQQLNSPIYQHFRGQVPQYGPND